MNRINHFFHHKGFLLEIVKKISISPDVLIKEHPSLAWHAKSFNGTSGILNVKIYMFCFKIYLIFVVFPRIENLCLEIIVVI